VSRINEKPNSRSSTGAYQAPADDDVRVVSHHRRRGENSVHRELEDDDDRVGRPEAALSDESATRHPPVDAQRQRRGQDGATV
jgi:hypothetical protein